MHHFSVRFALSLSLLLLAGCGESRGTGPQSFPTLPTDAATAEPTSVQPTEAVPIPTPAPEAFYIHPGVPGSVARNASEVLTQAGFLAAAGPEGASVEVTLNPGIDAAATAQWVYALATPFPTIPDEVAWANFVAYWRGEQAALPPFDTPPQIILNADTADMLLAMLGPAGSGIALTILPSEASAEITTWAWDRQPAISVMPFNELEPRWKVLAIDGVNPLNKAADLSTYPLTAQIGIVGDPRGAQALGLTWQVTNRDIAKMDVVIMTGVTALSRAVAKSMETYGFDYPTQKILPFIADADILHTSNEASFDPDCPEQDWFGEPRFCEHRKYYELFNTMGLDIVELTGNHNLDYGTGAALNSLDIYDAEALPYFGGGRNLEDATTPRILVGPSGTRFAFIGCNSAGPYGAWATAQSPGAYPCEDWTRILQQIRDLKGGDQADIVIVTLQYQELDSYAPSDQQRREFEALSAAGADIVSGSQAHQPQGFSFVDGRFVHFGLGNVIFDQIDYAENRQMFMDRHIFYEGRHISTILFTGWFQEVAQARPMTPEERGDLLRTVFAASGW